MRKLKIAFVGDSVTFGSGVNDHENYVEFIQRKQLHFDAYNYGVPGYGIIEVEETVENIIKDNFDIVIYTYNFNDIHPMTVGYLSLLMKADTRFASIDQFQGNWGIIKLFLKDHFKAAFVFRDLILNKSIFLMEKISQEAVFEDEPPVMCYDDLVIHMKNEGHQQLLSLWEKMYSTPLLLEKLNDRFSSMNSKTTSAHVDFFVLVFYDFHIMEQDGQFFHEIINDVLARSKVKTIDTYSFFERYYKECTFYSDIGHPGKLGNEQFGEFIIKYIINKRT
jgi:hypothetical protein